MSHSFKFQRDSAQPRKVNLMTASHRLSGVYYIIEGFKLIFKPKLKRFVFIPLILNIALFAGAFWLSQHYFAIFSHWLANHLPHWLQWIEYILWFLFFLLFCLIMVYSSVTLANLIGAPFNSLLSAHVEYYLTGKKQKSETFFNITKDIPRVVGRQIEIFIYYLPKAVLFFIIFYIPVVQLAAAALYFIFNAWFTTLQLVDYPTDNHRIPLATVKAQLKKKRFLALTFGAGVLFFSIIPIINFFIIPAAVAGATKLWLEELAQFPISMNNKIKGL